MAEVTGLTDAEAKELCKPIDSATKVHTFNSFSIFFYLTHFGKFLFYQSHSAHSSSYVCI